MRAGERDQRITIESAIVAITGVGDSAETWTTFKTAWARIVTGGGKEFIDAKEINSDLTHLVTTRYISGVLPGMRIVHGGKYFNILAVFDPFNDRDQLRLICNEQL